jgi:hypothetical protein
VEAANRLAKKQKNRLQKEQNRPVELKKKAGGGR